MAKIVRFEELEAWQSARTLTRRIYEVSSREPFVRDFGLRDQIRRAAVSGMSNIAEGFERDGDREFRQFLSNAKGSTGEVRSQLYVALDVNFIDQPQFEELYALTLQTGRLVGGMMRYLGASDLRGPKFK